MNAMFLWTCTFDLAQHQVVNRTTVISSSLVQSLVSPASPNAQHSRTIGTHSASGIDGCALHTVCPRKNDTWLLKIL